MRSRLNIPVIFIITACFAYVCPAAETSDPSDPNRYLDAVRTFADNVLKYGRDTYGPKYTPLFVDGLNIHTHEPVKWISPKGGDPLTATETEEWILSNFASQQTLLRTLDGLSTLTGDPKYRDAAMQAIRYAFDNLRTPNGLLYWGRIAAYDALNDIVRGSHESVRCHYPHYDLMWKVDPDATRRLIESFWSAHILNWSNLDMNRIGATQGTPVEPWNHQYSTEGPVFFEGKGLAFLPTATSLIHAGIALHKLSGQAQPLLWSKRLAKRYVDTRHPATGISYEAYNTRWPELGKDLKAHFANPRTTYFPASSFSTDVTNAAPTTFCYPWMSMLLTGEIAGQGGKEFIQWAAEEFTAWGKASYRSEDNSFIPILTDDTKLEGYVWKGIPGVGALVVRPLKADTQIFWAYSTAYRVTDDEFIWQMVRDIAMGNGFGDIGERPVSTSKLQTNTTCSDVSALLGFLELYSKTHKRAYREMGQRIGDNILLNRFHKGFFQPSQRHIYARFDCFEPLALLHLHAAVTRRMGSIPQVWPSNPQFRLPYRHKQEGVDLQVIYDLTESTELPLSLQEAAAVGDMKMIQSLLEKGVRVDSWDDSLNKTALHYAAMNGHKEIAEFLLAKGADVSLRDGFPGATALHYAAEKDQRGIAEFLIAHGADVNAKRGYPAGDRPLHSAIRAGHKDIVELLIEKGADVNARNDAGRKPLDIAMNQNRKEVVDLLRKHGAQQ